jgi:hypothetical protein
VMRLDLVSGHGDLWRAARWPRVPGASAPAGRSGSAVSPRAAPARPPCPGCSPQETEQTGRIAELGPPASRGGGLGGVAWTSPRFWSGESRSAARAKASVGLPFDASLSNRRRADSAPMPTRGWDATTTGTQASGSNIQAGTSRHRPASPPRLHRNAVVLPLSVTSWTWTDKPLQGCHGYKSIRSVVLWAFRRRVLQRRTPTQRPRRADP